MNMLRLLLIMLCMGISHLSFSLNLDDISALLNDANVVKGNYVQKVTKGSDAAPIISKGEIVVATQSGIILKNTGIVKVTKVFSGSKVKYWVYKDGKPKSKTSSNRIDKILSSMLSSIIFGETSYLEANFNIEINENKIDSSASRKWIIKATPKTSPLRGRLDSITLIGEYYIDSIDIQLSNNASIVIMFMNMKRSHRISAEDCRYLSQLCK